MIVELVQLSENPDDGFCNHSFPRVQGLCLGHEVRYYCSKCLRPLRCMSCNAGGQGGVYAREIYLWRGSGIAVCDSHVGTAHVSFLAYLFSEPMGGHEMYHDELRVHYTKIADPGGSVVRLALAPDPGEAIAMTADYNTQHALKVIEWVR